MQRTVQKANLATLDDNEYLQVHNSCTMTTVLGFHSRCTQFFSAFLIPAAPSNA
jgi:hypothetical protein